MIIVDVDQILRQHHQIVQHFFLRSAPLSICSHNIAIMAANCGHASLIQMERFTIFKSESALFLITTCHHIFAKENAYIVHMPKNNKIIRLYQMIRDKYFPAVFEKCQGTRTMYHPMP